ncbi:MAG: PAAR-like domain-containing protein, partial [Candidatus Methylumidiphilus sp.]
MADKHIADGESAFKAVSSAPDVCLVGNSPVPFDSFQILSAQRKYAATVKARGEHVLTIGSVIAGTQGNAGSGVISGTSLGSGDCTLLTGAGSVKAEKMPIARHLSDVSMNNGNTLGKLYTQGSSPNGTIEDSQQACQDPPKRSEFLDALEAQKKALESDSLNAHQLDQYVRFDETSQILQGGIDSLRPGPDSWPITQGAAGVGRAILSFGKDLALLPGQLAYTVAKRYSLATLSEDGVNALILAENIRLGNVCTEQVWQTTKAFGNAIVKPVTVPWERGDYAESITRGGLEIGTLVLPFTKFGKLGKGGNASSKLSQLEKEGEAANMEKTAAEIMESPPKKTDGVHIKARYGEKVANDRILKVEKDFEPVGNTNGEYKPGKQGIDGVYKNKKPPPDYVITEVKYGSSELNPKTADGKQMSDSWVNDRRLIDKVGQEQADEIRLA